MYLGIIIVSAIPTFVLSGVKKLIMKMRSGQNEQLDAA
ncbi:cation-transporting ATPase [Lentilactobacillus farraginis DSM 18382 = JCM 14108]|uniref:Cation-transporting ATPase n=1 Tax=Lentilactobacillus farraginis DSM 18382 = JCM 14108 TaxID=1423743 RepID=X0PK51_9LACO|nr:cation-transporting ATPase [Lentilactobacillus farraginis DSM 18382 = JCM 14108]